MERNKILTKFPVIDTSLIEEAEFKLSQTITDLQIIRMANRRRFRLEMNAFNFGRTSLIFNRFSSETELKTTLPAETAILAISNNFPTRFIVDGKEIIASPHKLAMVAPARQINIKRSDNSELLLLRVSIEDLMRHFRKLEKKPFNGPLIFKPNIDLRSCLGSKLKRLLNNLIYELEHNNLLKTSPTFRKAYDEMLLTAFLSLPHNLEDLLYEDRLHSVSPRIVSRAEEYMQAHLQEDITITDLLQICNCSRSSFFSAFQNFRGYTPKEFLTKQRLQSVRQKLLKAQSEESVSSIALNCGFTHLSRFSQAYRKRFGELPSETLRKVKK